MRELVPGKLTRSRAADLLSGGDDGIDDAGIAGAAADVPAQLMAHRRLVRAAYAPQNVARRDQHAGRAEAALQRMALMEMAAQHLPHLIGAPTFDGEHAAPAPHGGA